MLDTKPEEKPGGPQFEDVVKKVDAPAVLFNPEPRTLMNEAADQTAAMGRIAKVLGELAEYTFGREGYSNFHERQRDEAFENFLLWIKIGVIMNTLLLGTIAAMIGLK